MAISVIRRLLEQAGIDPKAAYDAMRGADPALVEEAAKEMEGLAAATRSVQEEAAEQAKRREKENAEKGMAAYESRRAYMKSQGMSADQYLSYLDEEIRTEVGGKRRAEVLNPLCEERQALRLAGVEGRGAAMTREKEVDLFGEKAVERTVTKSTPGAYVSESWTVADGKEPYRTGGSVQMFREDGRLADEWKRLDMDTGRWEKADLILPDGLAVPDVKGAVFQRTLLDLGWPENRVEAMTCQWDVEQQPKSDPVIKHLGDPDVPLYMDPLARGGEAFKRFESDMAAQYAEAEARAPEARRFQEPVVLARVNDDRIRAVPGKQGSGARQFEVEVDVPLEGGGITVGRIQVTEDRLARSTRRQGGRDVPCNGFHDVRVGGTGDSIAVRIPDASSAGGTKSVFMDATEIKQAHDAARSRAMEQRKAASAGPARGSEIGVPSAQGGSRGLSVEGIV